jgi:hypothetical protein
MIRLKLAVLVLSVACAMFPAIVHAQCTRCCFPAPNVSVSPVTAEEGQSVVVTTVLLNCSPIARVLTAKVNITPNNSSCASFAEAFSVTALVLPFRSRTVSYTFAAANCDGGYEVTESSSNAPGYATAILTVN